MPSLASLIQTYNPQMVILMLGTNDAMQGRSVANYIADMETIVQSLLNNGTICVLSTIPPMIHNLTLAEQYNDELWLLAETYGIPLIDFYGEILTRRPDMTWNGTLLVLDDVHPTGDRAGVTVSSAPTEANLRECGYLLRGWLSVRKVVEVKAAVID
jgi:lysophospholipase L1-like esterase